MLTQFKHSLSDDPCPPKKPIIVGIYGISGCGKSQVLKSLKNSLGGIGHDFLLIDGSEKINQVVPGGLDRFKTLSLEEKQDWRETAIDKVRDDCATSNAIGVVTGHYMLWNDESTGSGEQIWTTRDEQVYTHVLYLEVPAEQIAAQRKKDLFRERPKLSVEHLRKWQGIEKTRLRDVCRERRILFSVVARSTKGSIFEDATTSKVAALIRDFSKHNEGYNLDCAKRSLDLIHAVSHGTLESMLVLDADKTLAPIDTGSQFWKIAGSSSKNYKDPLKMLFKTQGYCYHSFRQAALLYEEKADDFDAICDKIASGVTMYPEFVSLLRKVKEHDRISAVVVTCGLRSVWEKVLANNDLTHVKVIGGGRISNEFVVTGEVKGALVNHLHETNLYVWGFGDSPLDLDMLSNADQAIVVVGEKKYRSKTMEDALITAVEKGLVARQVIIPDTEPPRLDLTRVPRVDLTKSHFFDSILGRTPPQHRVFHATEKNAAKVLMTPTRNADNAGPSLREAHRQVGWYLSIEYVTTLIGLEPYQIRHVQGCTTTGHRLQHEAQTLIVPLMRGGEPMAFGVSDAFPLASFLHAKKPEDVESRHLKGKRTVILVDSVVNSGKSIVEFVEHIREIELDIVIMIVSGVVQDKAISKGPLADILSLDRALSLVALRLSANKYTGKGSTDTGHRLFNTTDQD